MSAKNEDATIQRANIKLEPLWIDEKGKENQWMQSQTTTKTLEQKIKSKEIDPEPDSFIPSAWQFDPKNEEYYLSGRCDLTTREKRWPELRIPRRHFERLYQHQKQGVQWMAGLHEEGIGGILGDDMGMGKTFQTLSFLGGLMKAHTIRNALIVCPMSVLRTWEREGDVVLKQGFSLKVIIIVLTGNASEARRRLIIESAACSTSQNPHIVVTTYGLISSQPHIFLPNMEETGRAAWDYICLDEGHKIKNQTAQVTKACHHICADKRARRLMLTGTPIQNNLKELWVLFDWATSGRLLGDHGSFRDRFARPIEDGRHKNAMRSAVRLAERSNAALQLKLKPHFLRRQKNSEFSNKLPVKREVVVWTHLSKKQRAMYAHYVDKEELIASAICGAMGSPLAAISWLKRLCSHPLLVLTDTRMLTDTYKDRLVKDSAKLEVLVALVDHLCASGHRTLIFSQSTHMLDIIEAVLSHVSTSRIDGTTKEKERQKCVDEFNEDDSKTTVMLLSTKAAGVGLTLTGADRAIIYDSSWNPAEENQAVDRCYRIGQMKDVTVYRFFSAGTVEERMYERQVHKDGIRHEVLGAVGRTAEKYFTKGELGRLFRLAPEGECEMLTRIVNETTTTDVKGTTKNSPGEPSFLESHPLVVGITSHDSLYSNPGKCEEMDECRAPLMGLSGPQEAKHHRIAPLQVANHNSGRSIAESKASLGVDTSAQAVPIGHQRTHKQKMYDAARSAAAAKIDETAMARIVKSTENMKLE